MIPNQSKINKLIKMTTLIIKMHLINYLHKNKVKSIQINMKILLYRINIKTISRLLFIKSLYVYKIVKYNLNLNNNPKPLLNQNNNNNSKNKNKKSSCLNTGNKLRYIMILNLYRKIHHPLQDQEKTIQTLAKDNDKSFKAASIHQGDILLKE